jgi:hypothetical protein
MDALSVNEGGCAPFRSRARGHLGAGAGRTSARLVEASAELTGARYAALGVIDANGTELEQFITHGIDDDLRAEIGALPRGRGILGVLIREANRCGCTTWSRIRVRSASRRRIRPCTAFSACRS